MNEWSFGGGKTSEEAISAVQVSHGEARPKGGAMQLGGTLSQAMGFHAHPHSPTTSPAQAGASLALLLVCSTRRCLITHRVYDEAERLFGKTATLISNSPQGRS